MADSHPEPKTIPQPPGQALSPNIRPTPAQALSPTDRPTERLLNRISSHVVYDHLFSVAVELGVTEAQFSQTKAASNNQPRYHIFKVLSCWANKTPGLSVEQLIDRVKEWRKKGHVVKQVWHNMQDLVDVDLPFGTADEPEPAEPFLFPQGRIEKIQYWTKQSLRTKPFSLAVGKDWTLRPSKTDLREIYTNLSWTRKHRKAYTVEQEDLKNITQILNEEQLGEDGPVRILVQGKGGIGKSTAMKHLAISWADGAAGELTKFQFVFHISLKHVKDNTPIEHIIVTQHRGLKANRVKPAEIRSILEGDAGCKVLLLIDGHDEYKVGRNSDIDQTIEKENLWNCWMILTSRETDDIKVLKEYMDAEVEIHGFDAAGIKQYMAQCVGSAERTEELLKQAVRSGLCEEHDYVNLAQEGLHGTHIKDYGILTIPILVNMIVVLFLSNLTLPDTKGGIMEAVVDRCIDREAIRAKGQKAMDEVKQTLIKLGKLAWQGLNEARRKLIFGKEEVIRVAGAEALELGLLFGTENLTPQEEEEDVLCFSHLLLQEFMAGKYVSELKRADLEVLFPTWESIRQHEEVVKFACELTSQPDVFTELIYDRLSAFICDRSPQQHRSGGLSVLGRVEKRVVEGATIDPLHNRYFNYVFPANNNSSDEFIRSRIYVSRSGIDSRAILYQSEDPGRDAEVRKYAVIAEGDDNLVCVRKLLQKVREFQPIQVTEVLSPSVEVVDFDRHSGAMTINTPSYIYGNQQLVNLLKVVQEIQKGQQVLFSKLEVQCVGSTTFSSASHAEVISGQSESMRVKRYKIFHRDKREFAIFHYGSPSLSPRIPRRGLIKLHTRQLDTVQARTGDKNRIIENLVLNNVKVSRNATSVSLWYNNLSPPVFRHIVRQLHGCKHLTSLQICFTSGIPVELGEALRTMTSLKEVYVGKSRMTSDVSCAVLLGLSRCRLLEKLYFGVGYMRDTAHVLEVVLSGSLKFLFDEEGLPAMTKLVLRGIKLNRTDACSIAEAVRNGQLPKLQELRLTDNTLTGCFTELLAPPGGFTCLQKLAMGGTNPSREDLRVISEAVAEGKLPALKEWSLANNCLTGCLGDTLGGPEHPGFSSLEALILWKSKLHEGDLSSMSRAIMNGKLPCLTDLDLSENNLWNAEDALQTLIQTCVENITEHKLALFLWDNKLRDKTQGVMKSQCQDSSSITLEL